MSKIMRVFYDNAGLPYKDSALSIHYPILEGGEFVGANNTTDIYFYTANLGDFYFVANCKLPNGALVDKLLVQGSDEFGDYFALSLDSELTENKGHLKVALKGYGGNVNIEEEQDGDTTIVVINGTPTIVATGIVDIAINYAPLVHYISSLTPSEYEQLLGAIGSKLDITKGIYVIADRTIDVSQFSEGQLVYSKADKLFYRVTSNTYVLEQVDIGSINVGDDTLANRLATLASDISDLQDDVDDLDTNKADKVGKLPSFNVTPNDKIADFVSTNLVSNDPIVIRVAGFSNAFIGRISLKNNNLVDFELDELGSNWRVYGTNVDGNSTFSTIIVNYHQYYELEENKVTTLSSSSTDKQFPSAKCVYNVQQLLTQAIDSSGHKIELSIDSNYDMVVKLLDANDNVISQDDIDLPLESIVVSADYYDTYTYGGTTYEKVIVITLATTDVPTIVPVGDLVDGLVNETQLTTALALKADKSTTYTKTEVDNALDLKANKIGPLPKYSVAPTDNISTFLTTNVLRDTAFAFSLTNGRKFIANFGWTGSPVVSFEIEEIGSEKRYIGTQIPTATFTTLTFSDVLSSTYENDFVTENTIDSWFTDVTIDEE